MQLIGKKVYHRAHKSYGQVAGVAFDPGAEPGEFRLLVVLDEGSAFGGKFGDDMFQVGRPLVNWKASACTVAKRGQKAVK